MSEPVFDEVSRSHLAYLPQDHRIDGLHECTKALVFEYRSIQSPKLAEG